MVSQIKQYRIERELGGGGFATVYLAHDTNLKRDVAIKVLHARLADDRDMRRFFEREAHLIASLDHLAVVPIHDFGEVDGQLYLVMRLMRGGTLAQRVAEGRKAFELPTVISLLERLGPTLDAMHARGVIHRDLKPSNILYDDAGVAYIADFGIAFIQQTTRLTQSGLSFGTPQYSSPEQITGEGKLDHRSDIYTLGVIVYELLTGQYPFWSDTPLGWVYQHLEAKVPDVRKVNRRLPDGVQGVLEKMLAKKPQARYASVQAVLTDLYHVSGGLARAGAPYGKDEHPVHPPRRRLTFLPAAWPIGIAVFAVVAVLLLLGWVVMQNATFTVASPSPIVPPTVAVPVVFSAPSPSPLPPSPTPLPTSTLLPTAPPPTIPVLVFTSTPLPLPTASATPTATVTPTATATVLVVVPTVRVCDISAAPDFAAFWSRHRDLIGCPVGQSTLIARIAEEVFEGGHLFWREDTNETYAIYDRIPNGGEVAQGTWQTDPRWNWGDAGEPDPDGIGLTPPPGRYEPRRGFGWLWRTYLGRESGALGWALDREYGFDHVGQSQYFENGLMFKGSSSRVYILLYDGRFVASPSAP